MGQLETNLKNKHDATLTKWQRLWRCNSGSAWGGKFLSAPEAFRRFGVKMSILIHPSKIELWPAGTPDLIGFDSIIITPDMVGRRVAVFVGTELKAGNDKMKPEQENWRDNIIVPKGGIHRLVSDDGVIESGFKITDNAKD